MKEKKVLNQVKKAVKAKGDKYRDFNQNSFKQSLKRLNTFYTSGPKKAKV